MLDGLPLGHSLSVFGNFLVTEDFTVKIADLGEARKIVPDGEQRYEEAPVPAFSWCPPEVLDLSGTTSTYTPASDIFGISMVLSEIINNELPLEKIIRSRKLSYEELLRMLSIEKRRPALPDALPKALADILGRAWDTEPTARPTASELLYVLDQCTSVLEREVPV